MRRWMPYPFVRFVVFFIAGILGGIYLEGWIMAAFILFVTATVLYLLFQIVSSKGIYQYFVLPIGICGFFVLLSLGYINVYLSDEKNKATHLLHETSLNYKYPQYYQATVIAPLKEKERSFGTLVQLEATKADSSWKAVTGKILVYIKKDSLLTAESVKYGDRVLIKMTPHSIKGPLNPNAFDYKQFLRYQNIHFNAYISMDDLHMVGHEGTSLHGLAIRFQHACAEIIRKNISNKEAAGIVLSLVLGLKDDLEQPIKTAYASAGVMHILAVSGLHVGIFYSILLFVLGWLNYGKFKWVFALVCLVVLWAYAFTTGLSPSVLRAVTMFSSIIIAKAFARQYNVYNAIAASAFFLLCYDPFLIMSVGFQLSYIAVLGIILLHSKFYKLLSIENRFIDAIWQMTCVSLAAQLAVLPLSIYYFHQFPVYFLLANLLVIPAAFVMLALSIALLVFHFIPGAEWLLGNVLELLVVWVNKFVYFVNTLPHSNLSGMQINGWQVVFLMGILIGGLVFLKFRKFATLTCIVILFGSFQMVELLQHWDSSEKSITYYSSKTTGVVGLNEGSFMRLLITSGDSLESEDYEYNVKPSILGKPIDKIGWPRALRHDSVLQKTAFEYGVAMVWNGKRLVVIDKKVPENWQLGYDTACDVLILENNAAGDLTALPSNLFFEALIIGNSNTYTVANRFKNGVESEDLKIFFPKEEGAFVMSW